MSQRLTKASNQRSGCGAARGLAISFTAALLLSTAASATEKGASVYPVGVETVMPGMTPAPRATTLFEFSAFYTANEMDNSLGKSVAPEFKLRVFANAVKVAHNWNIPVLGGFLNSNIAVPSIYQELHVAPGSFSKTGLSNVDIGVLAVGYQKGDWHWFYEGDVFLPGAPFAQSAVLNIGQHNYAAAPVGGFTYLPHHGAWEVSSKGLYIVNFQDAASHYRSGNELTWEYDAMREVSRKAALGINGYLYQQTTDDMQNGLIAGDGNRGRDLAVGPELRIHFGAHDGLAVKYFRDTLVENKPRGNAFWFQMAVPFGLGRSAK